MAGTGHFPRLLLVFLEGVGNTREQPDEQLSDEIILADNDLADLLFDAVDNFPRPLMAEFRDGSPFQGLALLLEPCLYKNVPASIQMKAAAKK